MPIYEYRCDACGHYLDALQKIADAPLRDCPCCEASALRRLVSAPNFRLKGSGWYETDFKSDKERKRNLVEHPDEPIAGKDKAEPKKAEGDPGKAAGDSGKGERSTRTESSSAERSSGSSGTAARSKSRPVRGSGSAAA